MSKPIISATFDHYVPKFLLRKFARRKKNQFYVRALDKRTGKKFESNINTIMGENNFNSVRIGKAFFRIEEATARLDDLAAPIIEELIQTKSIANLKPQSTASLLLFIALQINRGRAAREMHDDAMQQARDKILRSVGSENLPSDFMSLGSAEENKLFHLQFTMENMEELAFALGRLRPVLYECGAGENFLMGDGLVAFHNGQPQNDIFGNLGIMCKGIEVYMPIAPKISLGLICPSIIEDFVAGHESCRLALRNIEAMENLSTGWRAEAIAIERRKLEVAYKRVQILCDAFALDRPVPIEPENALHQNSLQVLYAERYVISADGSFHPAEAMLRDNSRFAFGPRMKVS